MAQQIVIDKEFQSLIPPLSAEEKQQLEANLVADGCRDPLVVWGNTLIDGHNRFEICTRLGLLFNTIEKQFESRDEVVLWMCINQLGRRNISSYDRGLLALRMKRIFEDKAKEKRLETQGRPEKLSPISDAVIAPVEKIRTDKAVADLAELGKDTIRKIEKIAATGSPELVQAVRSGEISINLASDLATLEKDKQNAVVGSGKKVAQEAVKAIKQEQAFVKKEARREVINAQVEAISQGTLEQPQGLFDVIAIDPPWNYGREYDPDTSRVANPYPEMTQEQIKAIDLPSNDDSVLFLWTTHQFLFDAKELLDHWGFTYKATMVWDKERIGMGAWLRMQCEFCLVGIKGKPFWDNTEHRDIIRESRREHSRKPEAFYTTAEKITAGRRLEYFARSAHTGWEVFGNDTTKF